MKSDVKKILVASARLDKLGGSETFTYTLIEELKKRENIYVEYFTLERGHVSDKIERQLGVSFKSLKKYDLILANHNTCINKLFNSGFIIQTCHGIYPKLEQPHYLADAYVSISQEVQNHLDNLGYSSRIIHNGININRFTITHPINFKLKTVLSMCHSDAANDMVKMVCNEMGLEYLQAFKYDEPIWSVEDIINKSDLVVGLGRSAYEAMSCGRPVVIFDSRHYFDSFGDGYIRDKLGLSLKNNCSGRYFKFKFDTCSLKTEFSKYESSDGSYFREIVLKEFNVSKNVDLYLEYWEKSKTLQDIKIKLIIKKKFRKLLGRKLALVIYKCKDYLK